MKSKLYLHRGATILACAASLATTAVAVAPTPVFAAAGSEACPDKAIKVAVPGAKASLVPVKAIRAEGGATCAEAYKVIAGFLANQPPKGWVAAVAKFEAPEGLIPQEAKKGNKKIKYAVRGG